MGYRDYQTEAIRLALQAMNANNPRPAVLVLATGAGKSHVIAGISESLGGNTLIFQPSKELLEQNFDKMAKSGIQGVAVYSASLGEKNISRYTLATIGSVVNCPEKFSHIDNVIIDECDLVNPKDVTTMYHKFLVAIGCRRVIGLTATPYRHVLKFHRKNGLSHYTGTLKVINRIGYPSFWGSIIYKIEAQELIDRGYLAPIRYHVGNIPDRKLRLNNSGTDYTKESLDKWGGDKVGYIAKLVDSLQGKHHRMLVFASSVRQAQQIVERLTQHEIASDIVEANTKKKDRQQIVDGFKRGDRRILINVGVFIAGLDVPELDCIIYARPTLSLRIWYQSVGRGLRVDPNNPDKILHVYDLASATKKLGRVETIRMTKEEDGFRDAVTSEGRRMDERPLFDFAIDEK